jgi:molecular chaperone GrpE (heat shock protein)
MHDLPGHSDDMGEQPTPTPQDIQEAGNQPELLGAVDIVAAFTALRHELKLQVRGGRELQQEIGQRLQQMERAVAAVPAHEGEAMQHARQLAEAMAELQERLQRAVQSLAEPLPAMDRETDILENFDRTVSQASWGARTFAARLLRELRQVFAQLDSELSELREVLRATRKGLELLLERVHYLMGQCEIERVDVLHQAFDAESMQAIDTVADSTIPSSHVAEQIRPAYRWRGKVICPASVRLAK